MRPNATSRTRVSRRWQNVVVNPDRRLRGKADRKSINKSSIFPQKPRAAHYYPAETSFWQSNLFNLPCHGRNRIWLFLLECTMSLLQAVINIPHRYTQTRQIMVISTGGGLIARSVLKINGMPLYLILRSDLLWRKRQHRFYQGTTTAMLRSESRHSSC